MVDEIDFPPKSLPLVPNNDIGLMVFSMLSRGNPTSAQDSQGGCSLTNIPSSGIANTTLIFVLDLNTGKCIRGRDLSRFHVYGVDISSTDVFVAGTGKPEWTYQIETSAPKKSVNFTASPFDLNSYKPFEDFMVSAAFRLNLLTLRYQAHWMQNSAACTVTVTKSSCY